MLEERVSLAKRLVDLGCGAVPHPKAAVGVDAYLTPVQRGLGQGEFLSAAVFRDQGVEFVQAELTALPFKDGEFDFAYASHVFEHLPDPRAACAEMQRVAGAGGIITPSVFAEFAFGRPYHLWLVLERGNTLIFVRKRACDDRPFGEHPEPRAGGGYRATDETNPFEILLNDEKWYWGREQMPRLSRLLRKYWYSHSPVTEVVFCWEGSFRCVVIDENGNQR